MQPLGCKGVGYVDLGVSGVSLRRSSARLVSQCRAGKCHIYAMENKLCEEGRIKSYLFSHLLVFPLSTFPLSLNNTKLTFLLSFLSQAYFFWSNTTTPFKMLSSHVQPMLLKNNFPPIPRLLTAINRRGSQMKSYSSGL